MYVYGPIPSRRLGRSLGVNVVPLKTCSYSCIYCQLGRTSDLRIQRESFYPRQKVLDAIVGAFPAARPDYITIVGDGEPTLYRDLGWLIRHIKTLLPAPVAVITNGSLLCRKDVRQDLEAADVVIPSVDAGNEQLFNKINRPHGGLDFENVLRGLCTFAQSYSGQLWVEVMLVRGVNDSPEALANIKAVLERIGPDQVDLLTPTRPPAEPWVQCPTYETLAVAESTINRSTPVTGPEPCDFDLQTYTDARQAILSISRHHPIREDQLLLIERRFGVRGVMQGLLAAGELVETTYDGTHYFTPAQGAAS